MEGETLEELELKAVLDIKEMSKNRKENESWEEYYERVMNIRMSNL